MAASQPIDVPNTPGFDDGTPRHLNPGARLETAAAQVLSGAARSIGRQHPKSRVPYAMPAERASTCILLRWPRTTRHHGGGASRALPLTYPRERGPCLAHPFMKLLRKPGCCLPCSCSSGYCFIGQKSKKRLCLMRNVHGAGARKPVLCPPHQPLLLLAPLPDQLCFYFIQCRLPGRSYSYCYKAARHRCRSKPRFSGHRLCRHRHRHCCCASGPNLSLIHI